MPFSDVLDDDTGEFDPLGTLFVLVLLAGFGYLAYYSYNRYRVDDRKRWLAGMAVGGFFTVIIVITLVLNLSAALGLI